MTEIRLTKDKVTVVDETDYQLLVQYKWHCTSTGYAATRAGNKIIYMHRLLLGAVKGQLVDHMNHDKLDNRRSNLRLATKKQNIANMKIDRKGTKTSVYKGVYLNQDGTWSAQCVVNGKRTYLGRFETQEKAAICYNNAALSEWAEFAYLNVVNRE